MPTISADGGEWHSFLAFSCMKQAKNHHRKRTKAAGDKSSRKRKGATGNKSRWSGKVTRNSNALDLDKGVFKLDDTEKIARSLNRSAHRSTRKKAGSYRSAMSMLNF
ncbi:MAG TPA: DUF3175 domain-containing protein, partial [Puia sp.]|nr:DUF3175 domain-containing protein [Puia sp.]